MAEAFNYVEARDDADELIAEFGQTVALRRLASTGHASEPSFSSTDYATKAAILDYTARQIDGVNILATDRRALVSAGPLTAAGVTAIKPPDAIVVGGVPIPVVRVMPLAPAGAVVVYDCQLRV